MKVFALWRRAASILAFRNAAAVRTEDLVRRRFRFWQVEFPVPVPEIPAHAKYFPVLLHTEFD